MNSVREPPVVSATREPMHECLAACLIADAERYTTLTEGMAPAAVVELINRYFRALFAPILRNGGAVSDVKGDGLLAVWRCDATPSMLKRSVCKACLAMIRAVDALKLVHPEQHMPTRLGVDFGLVAIASVGAHARYEYRPVGDPVNTASRLEELNKALRTRILVSEAFARDVDGFVFRDLGSFHLRGKRTWTRVHELVGAAGECEPRALDLCREFRRAVAAYDAGREVEAQRQFRALQSRYPEDGPTRHYLQRLLGLSSASEAIERERVERGGWLERLWAPPVSGRAK
jgi:adenylate cyclase